MPKPKGYNWKARQARRGESDRKTNEKDETSTTGSSNYYGAIGADTNALILPSKRKPLEDDENSKRAPKRKKLSNKEKKRLTKIVEIKEKKSRVNIPISAHPRGVFPPTFVLHV